MKNNKTITIMDIIVYLMNDLLGWFIIIWFDSTGNDGKFQDLSLHRVILAIGLIHIVLSLLCNVFLFKKKKIGNKLFIYNVVMTILPYLYLAFTWFIP
ncbi:hypothetical protein [Ruminococcus albus]|uniref:Uncharacterized protein n=1 Tax=Ruminococcus albus TaxID=1264 RepID=A0A1H7KQW7_RUMAL|nr:hypothetical protein [Ruminococcus albus]SEK89201.1 hypothetical protein SAMN05216469_10766 [Ruminococcus albus]